MSTHNMSLANQALKEFYLPGLRNQINDASPILAEMERDSESVSGREIVMALKYGRSGGVGNRPDDGKMPIAKPRLVRQAKWETKNIFAQIQITDKTIKASRDRSGAFADLLESDLDDARVDAQDSVARQVFGDGTGVVAEVKTAGTGLTTIEVADADNLSEGQFIDIFNTGLTTAKEEALSITAIDYETNQVTIAGSGVDVAAGDKIVIHGNLNEEITGFGAVFTPDNTLYGINRQTYKFFNPHTHALNGEISEVAIQARIDEVDKRAGGRTNFLSGSYGVRRAYQNLLLATKQTVNVMDLKGGYQALSYNGMPFAVDKYNPEGVLYGLDMSTWKTYHMGDWEWMEDGGGSVIQKMTGYAQWEATLAKYMDLGCDKPRGNWAMTGITEH